MPSLVWKPSEGGILTALGTLEMLQKEAKVLRD